jgi:hypothetical protein
MEQQSTPFSSTNQMPPLGPAPAQLPPLNHPPSSHSITNGTKSVDEHKAEPTVPIQTQFESLSLHTPLQPPPANNNPTQQQFPSYQINNELSGAQESVDDNQIDNEAELNPTGELSNEDGSRGMNEKMNFCCCK